MGKRYQITITEEALRDLATIGDRSARESIQAKIGELATDPQLRGKPLTDELGGFYRIKARQRWRVIYRIAVLEGVVVVVLIGIRKQGDKRDAYKIAYKRLS